MFRQRTAEPFDAYTMSRVEMSHSDGDLSRICGQGVFTKLRLLPKAGTKEEKTFLNHKNRRSGFSKRKNTQLHSGYPFDLSPIDSKTDFQTHEAYMSGETSTSSSTFSFQARSQHSTGDPIAQIEFHGIPGTENAFHSLSSIDTNSEVGLDPTPKASNNSKPQPTHYMDDTPEPVQQHPRKKVSSPNLFTSHSKSLSAVEEVTSSEDYGGDFQANQSFQSTISSKESGDGDDGIASANRQNQDTQDRMINAMKDMIVQQQKNIQDLDSKNHMYRSRLVASHDRVVDLRKEQMDQKDSIIKLQFERESFEAEAIWLREELLALKNQAHSRKNDLDGQSNLETKSDSSQQSSEISTRTEGSSEIRWSRAQRYTLNRNTMDEILEEAVVAISPRIRAVQSNTVTRPTLRIITEVDDLSLTSPSSEIPEELSGVVLAQSPLVSKHTPPLVTNAQKGVYNSPKCDQDPLSTKVLIKPTTLPTPSHPLPSPPVETNLNDSDTDLRWARAQMKVINLIKEDIKSRDPLAYEKVYNGPLGERDSFSSEVSASKAPNLNLKTRVMKLRSSFEKMQIGVKEGSNKIDDRRDDTSSLRTEVGKGVEEGSCNYHDRDGIDLDRESRDVDEIVISSPLLVHYQLKGKLRVSHDGTDSI